jgi:AcrR family transcriptional regulator
MTEIAERAGVATANIYRYYPNKAALFEAVLPDELIDAHDQLLDARVGALATILRSTDDPARLRAAIEGFWSYQVPGLDGLLAWMRRPPRRS